MEYVYVAKTEKNGLTKVLRGSRGVDEQITMANMIRVGGYNDSAPPYAVEAFNCVIFKLGDAVIFDLPLDISHRSARLELDLLMYTLKITLNVLQADKYAFKRMGSLVGILGLVLKGLLL